MRSKSSAGFVDLVSGMSYPLSVSLFDLDTVRQCRHFSEKWGSEFGLRRFPAISETFQCQDHSDNLNFIVSDPVDKAENTPNLPGNVASLVFFPSFLPFSFLLLFFLFFLTLFTLFYLRKILERETIKCSNFLWS